EPAGARSLAGRAGAGIAGAAQRAAPQPVAAVGERVQAITHAFNRVAAAAVLAAAAALAPVPLAAEIAPHRALYSMTLGSIRNASEVPDARGAMVYQWGETCDGWTIEQRYRLKLRYSGAGDTDVVSRFITWESKDGLRYRFSEKETRNGSVTEEISGEA